MNTHFRRRHFLSAIGATLALPFLASLVPIATLHGAETAGGDVNSLAGRKTVFLGDSITQGGGYVTFKGGVAKLIEQCKAAGVKEVFLVTPEIPAPALFGPTCRRMQG